MVPSFYRANLTISGTPTDTYLATCGWGHGHVWINGFEVGKYWSIGPQFTLYVPGPVLRQGANEILIFEVDHASADASVSFVGAPDFTGAGCKALAAADGTDSEVTITPFLVLDPKVASEAVHRGVPHDEARRLASTDYATWQARRLSPPSARLKAATHLGACGAPVAGTNLTLQPCAAAGATGVWALVSGKPGVAGSGRFQSTANPALCMGAYGTNPDTGSPNLAALPCAASGDRSQDWIFFADNGGKLMQVASGQFMDVPNSDSQPGARLETYANNGAYPNQKWAWDEATGALTTGMNGFCVSACA